MAVDLATIRRQCERFRSSLPSSSLLYAMKALPDRGVVAYMKGLVDGFDAASLSEIHVLLELGVPPEQVFFNNPVKSAHEVAGAAAVGVNKFTAQSVAEIKKIADNAPGSQVDLRVKIDDSESAVPLSSKFGCDFSDLPNLARECANRGVRPAGLAFHVGSQATDPDLWSRAIAACDVAFRSLVDDDDLVRHVNIGGGFPAQYHADELEFEYVADKIATSMKKHSEYAYTAEPGRFLVAEAGAIVATVIGLEVRNGKPWAFVDVGHFQAFVGAERYDRFPYAPFSLPGAQADASQVNGNSGTLCEFTLTGPSCDAADVIMDSASLPAALAVGDRVVFPRTGAYTTVYGSGFNGFPVPPVVCVDFGDEPVDAWNL